MNSLLSPISCLALFVGCLTAAASEPGASDELLWQLAIKHVKQAKSLVASKVVTQITVRDDDNVLLGSIESVDMATFPRNGQPVWVNLSKKTAGSPGVTMELNLHLEESPADILDGYDTWTPKGLGRYEGEPVMLWEGVSAKETANRALVYIDPETGRPGQADLFMPIRSNLGTRSVAVTVNFGPGPRATWVPLTATIDQSGRFLFWKRHLVITKWFQDWVDRGSIELTAAPAP